VVDSRQHAAITIDPASQFGAPEIIWIINHPAAAITATVLRGRENTTPRQHNQGVRWSHAPTTWDHDRPKSAAIRVYAKSMWR